LWPYRNEGQLFLDLLARGKLVLDDLITHRIDPSRANEVYESLRIGDPRLIGIMFDWTNYASTYDHPKTTRI
jgi:threonine dehydrogenase-like Zn-dependent dehydrogenase